MVLDYIGGGELYTHLEERSIFDEPTARFYAAQIVLALGFLHEHKVMYLIYYHNTNQPTSHYSAINTTNFQNSPFDYSKIQGSQT